MIAGYIPRQAKPQRHALRPRAVVHAIAVLVAVSAPPGVAIAQSMGPFGASVAPAPVAFDLPAQPLADALRQFERQARQEVRVDAGLLQGRQSNAVSGSHDVVKALEQLIAGTGLAIGPSRGAIMTLVPAPAAASTAAPAAAAKDAGTVQAGEGESAQTLATVTVTADALDETTENSGSYTTGGVTSGKATRSLRETPQSVTVVTRYRLDDQNMRTIDDALLNTPGIVAEQQSSMERNFYSRGFKIETIQYDGVPTQRENGFLISPDLSAYDRVEVLRGPAGLFNGAGNPGATVNLVRKRPTPYQQYQAQARLGSWDYKRVDADLSAPLNEAGSLRGRLVAAHEDRDFFYDFADAKKSVLYAILEADVGPNTKLGGGINYEKGKSIPFYSGLLRYSNGVDLKLPRSTYSNGPWSKLDSSSKTFFVDLDHRFNDDWRLKLNVARMLEDNNGFTGAACCSITPGTTAASAVTGANFSAFDDRLVGKQVVMDGNLQGSFEAFGRRHDVLVGANYMRRNYDYDYDLYAGTVYNPFTYDPNTFDFRPSQFTRTASTNAYLEQSGLYGSLRLALTDQTKLLLGGRVSAWKNRTKNRLTDTVTNDYKESGVFTPYVAVTYDLRPEWTAYASYAEIFRSQSDRFTAAGERLDPATGGNAEIGIKGELLDKRLNMSVALFRTIENNRSSIDPNNPSPCDASPTGGACYIAEGKVRSQGLDAELTGAITPRWQLSVGYTYNQTRYLRDLTASGAASGNQGAPLSTFTPRHLLRVWTAYKLPGAASAWTVAGGVNFQSKTWKTNASSNNANPPTLYVEQPKYAVWSGRVSWQINRNVQAALNVNNIFDKVYYRTIGTTLGNWYGEPRNVMLSLHAAF
jgi:outer membrane receptor for ferric coprogen and ferric-rhodotorulic acid